MADKELTDKIHAYICNRWELHPRKKTSIGNLKWDLKCTNKEIDDVIFELVSVRDVVRWSYGKLMPMERR